MSPGSPDPRACAAPLAALAFGCMLVATPAHPAEPDTLSVNDPNRYRIVVSATKTVKDPINLPNGTAVVSGRELRLSGARTLADALIDVAALETGDGSDNGPHQPNIGLWGLKEFDALLVTVDGVPVGGPFNPSLAQIDIDDVERIEIVKGPQGTLHGIAAFAGMVQVFTDHANVRQGSLSVGGGDLGNFHGDVRGQRAIHGWTLDGSAAGLRDDGWQDRTGSERARGRLSLAHALWGGKGSIDLLGLHDKADWGSPLPVEGGEPVAGFDRDRNYAIHGAVQKHDIVGLDTHGSWPLRSNVRLDHTMGFEHDAQRTVLSFVTDPGLVSGNIVDMNGFELEPRENSLYEDLRAVTGLEAMGRHELVTGASLTWGRVQASGIGFDFTEDINAPGSAPDVSSVTVGDHRSFDDRRTFFGLYAHDEWTPVSQFTLTGGGRFDQVSEKLAAFGQEVGFPAVTTSDSRTDSDWSGDLGAVVHLVPEGTRDIEAVNLYGNWKSSFKPAAPNLTEAETAQILDPERTHSLEGGVKARALAGQLALEVSAFQMDFRNMVVSIQDPSGNPELVNAGHERFKGWDVSLAIAPNRVPGLRLSGGYGWHDPRFVQFTFVDPDNNQQDVSGHLLELTPRLLWNLRAAYAPATGMGGWMAVRHQGQRAFDKDNAEFTPPFDEIDAGLSFEVARARLTVAGRNLGDDRHFVAESEIGDGQLYVSPPRRFTAEVTLPF